MSRGYTIPIQYGPNGCQVEMSGNQTCRETQTLEIIKEFNRVYESKLTELGSVGGGDNLMAKLHLQQDWIRDLTQQNEMLVRAVEELEKEAADRVSMLEERLESGAQVMRKYKDNFSVYLNKTFQNLDLLQNDVCNLVEFIKRARDDGVWNTDELTFYTIDGQSLLKPETSPVRDEYRSAQPDKESEDALALRNQLADMEKRLSNCPKESDLQELNFKLHLKEEELDSLKRSSVALRDSLLYAMAEKQEEVACLQLQLQKVELKYCVAEEQLKVKEDQVKDMEKILINYAPKESDVQTEVNECLDTEACISGTASCPELESKEKLITDLKSELQCLKDRILYLECMRSCEEEQRKEREMIENERREKEKIENEKKETVRVEKTPTSTRPETPKRKKSPSPKRDKKHLRNCGKTLPPKQERVPSPKPARAASPKPVKASSPKRVRTPSPKRHKSHSPRRRTKQAASTQIPSESMPEPVQQKPPSPLCDCEKPNCPVTFSSETQTLTNRRIQTEGNCNCVCDKSSEKYEVCYCCGKNSNQFDTVNAQAGHPYDKAAPRQGSNEKKSNLKSNTVETYGQDKGRCHCSRKKCPNYDIVENAELDTRDSYSTPKKLVVSSNSSNKDNANWPYFYVCEADTAGQSNPVKEFFMHRNSEEKFILSTEDFHSNNDDYTRGSASKNKMSKKSCTLTSNKILHEYYGISDFSGSHGVIKNFQEVTTKVNLINVPKRAPIKTYINNLELNIKKGATASLGIKKRTPSPIKKNKKFS